MFSFIVESNGDPKITISIERRKPLEDYNNSGLIKRQKYKTF